MHLGERREPDCVGAGHARPLRLGQGQALLECERKPSAGRESTRDCLDQRLLVTEGEHRLEQQHGIERARGERWYLHDHEPAREAAGALTRDSDGACTRVYADVAAAELPSQEPSRPGDSATQVENGDAGVDSRVSREGQDLGPAHEALLLDVLAGAESRLLGSPQGFGDRAALVLAHGLSTNRRMSGTVVCFGCSGRGATLRAGQRPLPDLGKQLGPLAGLAGALLLLTVLARTVGIGGAGWLVGLASGLTLNLALARALWRDPSAGLGWASWVTLTRATLAVGVAALTAASFERPVATATLVALACIALALDFVDGWLARRTRTESALGAKLDGEVDAFLILVLSIEVAPTVGGWVLLIGLARYAFLAAGWALPWLRAPLPRRDWRKTVTASQGVALVIAASDVPPLAVSRVLLAVALVMLVESFGRDVWWLWRHRDEAPARLAAPRARHPASTTLAHAARPSRRVGRSRVPDPAVAVHPELFRAAPARGLVLVGLAVALPARARGIVSWSAGFCSAWSS